VVLDQAPWVTSHDAEVASNVNGLVEVVEVAVGAALAVAVIACEEILDDAWVVTIAKVVEVAALVLVYVVGRRAPGRGCLRHLVGIGKMAVHSLVVLGSEGDLDCESKKLTVHDHLHEREMAEEARRQAGEAVVVGHSETVVEVVEVPLGNGEFHLVRGQDHSMVVL
jgi:hypothetical protein